MRRENEDREQRGAVDRRRDEEVEEKKKAAAEEEEEKQNDKGKRAPPIMKGQGENHQLDAG